MTDERKRKELYNNLLKDNYDLPAYDKFTSDMADENLRRELYDNLIEDNYDLPAFEQFTSDIIGDKINTPAPDTTPAQQQDAPAPQAQPEQPRKSFFEQPTYDKAVEKADANIDKIRAIVQAHPEQAQALAEKYPAVKQYLQQRGITPQPQPKAKAQQAEQPTPIQQMQQLGGVNTPTANQNESGEQNTLHPPFRQVSEEEKNYREFKQFYDTNPAQAKKFLEENPEVEPEYFALLAKYDTKDFDAWVDKATPEQLQAVANQNAEIIKDYVKRNNPQKAVELGHSNPELAKTFRWITMSPEERLREQVAEVSETLSTQLTRLDEIIAEENKKDGKDGSFSLGYKLGLKSKEIYEELEKDIYRHPERHELEVARRMMDDVQKLISEADRKGNTTFFGGAARGFSNSYNDVRTWDWGNTDLVDNATLLRVLEKYEKSGMEALTESEKALLDAATIRQGAEQFFSENIGRGYTAGTSIAESIPMMIEMAISPASGIGSAIAKRVAKYAVKRFAKKLADKAVKKVVKTVARKGLQAGGRVAGDVLGAGVYTLTSGGASTLADAIDHINDAMLQGKPVNWQKELLHAFGRRTIEYHSEMVGEYFSVISKYAGKGLSSIAAKDLGKTLRLDKVVDFIDNIEGSKWCRFITDLEEKTKWSGMLGEPTEEIIGGIENAILVGDQTLDTDPETGVFSKDNLINTLLSTTLMSGFISGSKTLGYRTPKYKANKEMRNADEAGLSAFNGNSDLWNGLRNSLSFGNVEEVKTVLRDVMTNPDYTQEQRKAVLDYAKSATRYKGILAGEQKRRESGIDPQQMVNEEKSFEAGYDADEQTISDIAMEYANPDLGNKTEGERQAAWDGVQQSIEDQADLVATQMRREMAKTQHRADQMVKEVNIIDEDDPNKDKTVYLIDGNVTMLQGGKDVDTENSDQMVTIYDPNTGEKKAISSGEIRGFVSVMSADDVDAQIQNARDSFVQQAIDKAQGKITVNIGDEIPLSNGIMGKVLAISEDGEEITVGGIDENGNPQQEVMQRSDLQAVADATAIESYYQRHPNIARVEESENAEEQQPVAEEQQTTDEEQTPGSEETEQQTTDEEQTPGSEETEQQTTEETPQTNTMPQGYVEGVPDDYTNGMEVTYNEDGELRHAVVLGRVRFKKDHFIPDENGNIVELLITDSDDVVHMSVGELNGAIESYYVAQPEDTAAEEPQDIVEPATESETPATAITPERKMYEDLTAKYGEKTGQKVKATVADREKTLADTKKALDKAQKNYDEAPIGKEDKAEKDLRKAQTDYDNALADRDYWNKVKAEYDKVRNAALKEQQEKEKAAIEASEEREKQRQAEELAKRQEQAERGANAAHPAIREKWESAEKVDGFENEIALANGETIKGHYVLVESGAATPSHDPNNEFARYEGFPVDENGQTVNDRDYERDKQAQRITRQMADNYDSRALKDIPVVSNDGVVLSGNGRTMAGELAAQQNTDKAYIEHLKKYPQQFGFTAEQVSAMQHPRVVFVADENLPYTTETFAKFNAEEKKSQSKTEQAVKLGKTVDDATFGRIINTINRFNTIGDFYNDPKAAPQALAELHGAGVINDMQLAEMMDGDKISARGREILENMLIGKAFESNPDAIRQLAAFPSMRERVITALTEISNNIHLGEDYSLENELAEAINLTYQARKSGIKKGEKVNGFARQQNLFPFDTGDTVADYTNIIILSLGDRLNDDKVGALKKALSLYNQKAENSASGQYDMFSGVIKTKEEIYKEVEEILNYGTKQEQQSALDAADEQRKRNALQEREGETGVQEDGVADGSDAGAQPAGRGTEPAEQPRGEVAPKTNVTFGFDTNSPLGREILPLIKKWQVIYGNIRNRRRGFAKQNDKLKNFGENKDWKKYRDVDLYAVFDNNGNFIDFADSPRRAYDIALGSDVESFYVVRQQPTEDGLQYNGTTGWLFTNDIPENEWYNSEGRLREDVKTAATKSIADALPTVLQAEPKTNTNTPRELPDNPIYSTAQNISAYKDGDGENVVAISTESNRGMTLRFDNNGIVYKSNADVYNGFSLEQIFGAENAEKIMSALSQGEEIREIPQAKYLGKLIDNGSDIVFSETKPTEQQTDTTPTEEYQAPAPAEGESPLDYAERVAEGQKQHDKKQAETKAKTKIEDVGEKIGGARKDLAQQIAGKIRLDADTFPKMFPKFDLAKLVESGLDPKLAAAVMYLRQEAYAEYKSRAKRQTKEKALSGAKFFAAYAKQVLENGNTDVNFTDSGWKFTDYGKDVIRLNIDLYSKIHEKFGDDIFKLDLSGYRIVPISEAVYKYSKFYRRNEKGEEVEYTPAFEARTPHGSDRFEKGELNKAIDYLLQKLENSVSYDKAHPYKLSHYYTPGENNSSYVGVKLGGKVVALTDKGSSSEISKYLREHEAELQEKARRLDEERKQANKEKGTEGGKWKPQLNLGGGRSRVGEDYRGGRDIEAEEFRNTFGFRGVEFGNYVSQKDRQRFINEAYDAFMDLAALLGVSPKALGLGGQLGFAIGARGGGGKNAAHYEPELNVINLTKTQGAGALAHEWWHALDYYFNRIGDRRKTPATAVGSASGFSEGVRKEMKEAFLGLMDKIKNSDYYKRSKNLESNLHPLKMGEGYYDKPTELGARAFEDYVSRKLTDKGQVNDFLSSHTPEEKWDGEADTYPYPTGKDADAIDERFDNLFSTMQERTDEQGNVALFQKVGEEAQPVSESEAALRDGVISLKQEAGMEVSTKWKEAQKILDNANGAQLHKVYHGSGADFDAFDHSHMGEGEGAQAYGWGSYVTEVEGIGRTYAEAIAGDMAYKGEPVVSDPYSDKPAERALFYIEQEKGRQNAIRFLNSLIKDEDDAELINDYKETIKALRDEKSWSKPERFLYTVEIPDDKGSNYLEWDKPITEEQLKRIEDGLLERGIPQDMVESIRKGLRYKTNRTGRYVYRRIADMILRTANNPKQASEFLHSIGFTGIKYPANYRAGGNKEGNSNYVIFNENDLKITDKAKFFRTPDGQAYGFTLNGKIYIDPRIATAETPVHEYGHLWAQALRAANPEAWERLKGEMFKQKDVADYVRSKYPELKTDDEIAEEIFTHYSGKRGAERMRAEMKAEMDKANGVFEKAQVATVFAKLRDLLHKFWSMARDMFAGRMKSENIAKLTAEDFADMMMADLMHKVNPRERIEARDKEYMDAVEKGDMETAQRMVNEAAKEAGYTVKGYHGTSERFTIFDRAKSSRDNDRGRGFYFASERTDADKYAGTNGELQQDKLNQIDLYADNVVYDAGYEVGSPEYYEAYNKAYDEEMERLLKNRTVINAYLKIHNPFIIRPESTITTEEALDIARYIDNPIDRQTAEHYIKINGQGGTVSVEGFANTINNLTDVLIAHGKYDGIVDDTVKERYGFDSEAHVIALYPNQIKSADPVTYDDNGNVIPLSERFNSESEDIRYQLGDSPDTFESRQHKAVEDKGVVMPGLNEATLTVVDIPKHSYTGDIKEATKQAKKAAKAKFLQDGKPKKQHYDNHGFYFEYTISGNAIDESLNPEQQANSDNKGVHLAVVQNLDKVINESIEVEEHPDYLKNKFGNRDGSLVNDNSLMHRFYGAVTIDGKPYKVMTLMREDRNPEQGNGVHAYEVTKAEVLDDMSQSTSGGEGSGNNKLLSYPAAKLLKNVEKSYEKGKNILDESRKADQSTENEGDKNEPPLVVSDINGEHKVIKLTDTGLITTSEYNKENVEKLKQWLKDNKEHYVRLYHGTDADNTIETEGIHRTNNKNKHSYQSKNGYVYLSIYPSSSRLFGELGSGKNGKGVSVYAVDIKVKDLLPDTDQLNNKRAWGGEEYADMGNSLAESLLYGNGARVKRDILPYETSETLYRTLDPESDEVVDNAEVGTKPLSDREKVAKLEAEPKVKVYRSMQLIDGELYPPMSAKVDGQLREPSKLGVWEEADEAPDMADENGKFKLDKGNKKSLKAAYNPYIHTSRTMLNDQFSEAQDRPNLVVVEMEVPESELTSNYKAEKAKDSVGAKQWKAGVIQGQLSGTREVILTRWAKPVRIVPVEEVAENIVKQIEGQVDVMPSNVVTPDVRAALEARGVKFVETDNTGKIIEGQNKGKTWASVYGKKQKEIDTAKRQKAEQLSEKLHTPITIIEDVSEITHPNPAEQQRRRNAKGWYNPATGEVVIVLPNNGSVEDAVATVFHETVSHKGLRELVGEENYDNFLDEIHSHLQDDLKQRVNNAAYKEWADSGFTKDYQQCQRTATDELMADIAEKNPEDMTEKELSLWDKICHFVRQAIDKFLAKANIKLPKWLKLGENEIKYMLWKSRENLEGRTKADYVDMARDIAKRKELNLDNYEDNAVYSVKDSTPRAIARDEYERMVATGGYQFQEAMQDSMLGLRKAMQAILGAGKDFRIEEVAGNENAYLAENRMSSTNKAEQHNYYVHYMKPLLKAIHLIAGRSEAKRQELTDYMMAKHGLERNQKFAERDFAEYQKEYPATNKTLDDFRDRDYAGLTALTGETNVAAAEAKAQMMVDEYEATHDVTLLWEATKRATGVTLAKIYRSGLLSKESYEQIRDQFDYYIPLQGFDETTSDEVYGYLTSRKGPFGSPIKHAEGRTSKADDPIATIALMADKAIQQANRNEMKKLFLNFVENHPSDLVSVSKLWLHKDAATGDWVPVFPDIEADDTPAEVERKVEEFETKMQQLAEQHPKEYKSGMDAKNFPYRVLPENRNEHQVLVKRNGETFVLTINGNPRAAQALNGLTNPDVKTGGFIGGAMKTAQFVNHQLSAFYTTRDPNFVVSNFFRDMLYSNCMTWVKEGGNYALNFHKNFGKFNPATMRWLFGKWNKGTLDDSKPIEYMFKQFMLNGGETGYTNIRDIEAHKREIARELKRQSSTTRQVWSLLGKQLDLLNESVENCARFAAFITSMEMGRSLERSIYDAKEVSVNFNKKGSGDKMVGATGQTKAGKLGSYLSGAGRLLYVFWNAGLQGMTNFGRAAKRHPAKFTAGAAAMFTLGAVIPLIAKALWGGDDDDENAYYNLPEYVRRSNICIGAGDQWITIPLPIEFRAIYGMGELATGVITGEEHYSKGETARQIISQGSQILPLDFMEGGGGWHAFIPSQVKPIVEASSNKSWVGLPIYKDTPYNQNDPEFTKAYKSADKNIVGASRWLNELTGGDDFKKGAIDINPSKVEYVLNGYLGGYFKVPNQLIKMAETAFGDREFEWKNMIMVNRLVKSGDERTANRKLQNEFFNLKAEYEETKRLLKKYENAANEGVLKYAEKLDYLENSKEYGRYLIFDEYKKDIDGAYKAMKEAEDAEIYKASENEYYEYLRELVDAIHRYEKGEDINSILNYQSN